MPESTRADLALGMGELIAVAGTFADLPDDEEARALLDDHPEIRTPEIVAAMVDEARAEANDEVAEQLRGRAALLCGRDWPDGPELVCDLMQGLATVSMAVPAPGVLDRLLDVAGRVSAPEVADVIAEGMLAGLLTTAALVMFTACDNVGDLRLLDEALAVQRRAVEAGPGEGLTAGLRLGALAGGHVAKYDMTGDRALLEEAIAIYRRAVESVPDEAFERPLVLDGLATALDRLCLATGRGDLLLEAIKVQRRAVKLMERFLDDGDAEGGGALEMRQVHLRMLDQLARCLRRRSHWVDGQGLLDEAVVLHRRAVDGTPDGSRLAAGRLEGLATTLWRMYELRGDPDLLEEAVAVQRLAVATTPTDDVNHASRVGNLADLLALWAAGDQDAERLAEAWAMVEHIEAQTPVGRAYRARTRARVVRHDERRSDRFAIAAREAGAALDIVEQLGAAEPNPARRRDLAQQFDGLLGDLVVNVALCGELEQAVEHIEGGRVWLSAPMATTNGTTGATSPMPVAWIASSQWETVVITTTDHRTYDLHTIARDRLTMFRAVTANLNLMRTGLGATRDEQQQKLAARKGTVDELCSLATDIAEAFPRTEHLLVVPVGVCALLPYAAARRDDRYLIDDTALTVAPSLAWARAARRPRPAAHTIGAFHPGHDAANPLPLDKERRLFQKQFDAATVLDRPTAEDVLGHLDRDVDIAHFHCHGTYDVLDPFESRLDLETGLTIRAVLDHPASPWLVNLCACWTAICDIGASEQQISLPTAYLRAGAAHVLATLWTAMSTNNTVVNTTFYRRLAEGAHPAVALRHAIRTLRDLAFWTSGEELHPSHWATYTHFGTPSP